MYTTGANRHFRPSGEPGSPRSTTVAGILLNRLAEPGVLSFFGVPTIPALRNEYAKP